MDHYNKYNSAPPRGKDVVRYISITLLKRTERLHSIRLGAGKTLLSCYFTARYFISENRDILLRYVTIFENICADSISETDITSELYLLFII